MRYQTTRTIAPLKVCAIVLSLAAAASGCNGSPDGPSPIGPSPVGSTPTGPPASPPPPAPSAPSQAILRVTIDGGTCRGVAENVEVFVDGVSVGTINPGDGGVSRTVGAGDHNVSAVARTGNPQWASRIVNVPAAGYNLMLTCNGGSAPPPINPPGTGQATLRVILDATTCRNQVTTAEVFIDGLLVGVVQPGGAVSRVVTTGSHSVSARSATVNWNPSTANVGAGGFDFTLTCSGGGKPPLGPGLATISVVVDDRTCGGRASDISVSIDGRVTGTLQPGLALSRSVTPGAYSLSAASREGSRWGPRVIDVADRYTWTLTCSS